MGRGQRPGTGQRQRQGRGRGLDQSLKPIASNRLFPPLPRMQHACRRPWRDKGGLQIGMGFTRRCSRRCVGGRPVELARLMTCSCPQPPSSAIRAVHCHYPLCLWCSKLEGGPPVAGSVSSMVGKPSRRSMSTDRLLQRMPRQFTKDWQWVDISRASVMRQGSIAPGASQQHWQHRAARRLPNPYLPKARLAPAALTPPHQAAQARRTRPKHGTAISRTGQPQPSAAGSCPRRKPQRLYTFLKKKVYYVFRNKKICFRL